MYSLEFRMYNLLFVGVGIIFKSCLLEKIVVTKVGDFTEKIMYLKIVEKHC